jgi:predicted  nucleic acid-binding Zn-ribbon protein
MKTIKELAEDNKKLRQEIEKLKLEIKEVRVDFQIYLNRIKHEIMSVDSQYRQLCGGQPRTRWNE